MPDDAINEKLIDMESTTIVSLTHKLINWIDIKTNMPGSVLS